MRKIVYASIATLVLWISGAFLSVAWIDRTAEDEFPGKYQLAVARIFWSVTPSLDRETDANRAIKLSWLRASTDINRKEKKKIKKILQVLSEEFKFLTQYFETHGQLLSDTTRVRIATYLITYLNRVELFENYSSPALELKIQEFGPLVSTLSPAEQENWIREVMIRAYLKSDLQTYNDNRNQLVVLLNQHKGEVPADFVEGVISYYDGVLACIGKRPYLAIEPLSNAARKLALHPGYTINLLNQDMNVLLLGKGMESGAVCKQALINVISSGD